MPFSSPEGSSFAIRSIFDKPREIISRITRDLPDGNKYVQFIKKERIDLRESVFDFPKQNVITKDNVMTEIAEIERTVSPDEVIYVADSMTGQDAVRSAQEFARVLPLTGVLTTSS